MDSDNIDENILNNNIKCSFNINNLSSTLKKNNTLSEFERNSDNVLYKTEIPYKEYSNQAHLINEEQYEKGKIEFSDPNLSKKQSD